MSSDVLMSVRAVSKCYQIYSKPVHRLYQMLFAGRRTFYKEFWALKDVGFEIHRGEAIGIIGRNGAGKSTLLQVIAGVLSPTSGTIWSERGLRIAALLELGSGFNSEFTGRENVFLSASILGLTRQQTEGLFQEIVDFADIGDFIDQPVKKYSSGMKVRLAFAVNMAVSPDIMIVDEALAVGDAAFQRKCYAKIEQLLADGMTLLFVSHSTGTVKQFCQKCLYLKRGRQVEFGDVASVVARYLQDLFPKTSVPKAVQRNSEDSQRDPTNTDHKCEWRLDSKNASSAQQVFGCGGAKIESIEVLGVVKGVEFPPVGDEITIQIKLSWDGQSVRRIAERESVAPELYMGFHFANKKNVKAFGGNTYSLHIPINYDAVNEACLKFKFRMPSLAAGEYFLGAAVSLGKPTRGQAVHLWWGDGLLMLKSNNEVFGGVFAIDMSCIQK